LRCDARERILFYLLPTIENKRAVRIYVLSEEPNLFSGGYYTNLLLQKVTIFFLIIIKKIK